MKKLTQTYIQAIIGELKQKISAFAQFKGEYSQRVKELAKEQEQVDNDEHSGSNSGANSVEKARREAEQLRRRFEKLKNELKAAHDKASALKTRLEQAHRSAQQDVRTIESRQSSLKINKDALKPALAAAQREVQRLDSLLKELHTWLASSHNLLSSDDPSSSAGNGSSTSSWAFTFDTHGNPMLKAREGSRFQETIHFDNNFRVTASHVKPKKGDSMFMNPSDAFIADALFGSKSSGARTYTPSKKEWVGSGPSLVDQLMSVKQMSPYKERTHNSYTPPITNGYNTSSNYGMNFGRQDVYNNQGYKLGEVQNNFGNREIRNNMGGLEGKIENYFGQERLIRPDGTKQNILADGSVLSQHGVSQSQISNYQPPADPHAHWNNYGNMRISTLMDRMSSGQAGGGAYMPHFQSNYNPY